ncbi:unnamed protein product [Auanema sp. JU1783]|nr:unnamed protein product [Auanema sp. JU1783]
MDDESLKKSSFPSRNLAVIAFVVSIGGAFNFGYQLLITNPAQDAFLSFTNASLTKQNIHVSANELGDIWGIIVSSFFWGATIGSFLIQFLSEKLGRIRGLIFSLVIQCIACALTILSYFMTSHIVYTISRIILGGAISVSLGIAPIFITECSPSACRGVVSLITGIMIQVALVFGATIAMPQILGTSDTWWMLYLIQLVLTLNVIVYCLFIEDSPSYLLSIGKSEKAKKSLIYYHDITEEDAEILLIDMDEANVKQEVLGLFSIFKDKMSVKGCLLGSLCLVATTYSGIAAINSFAFEILVSVGLSSLEASIGNIIICLVTVFGNISASFLIDKQGRRPLLLIIFGLLAVNNIIISGLMYGFDRSQNVWMGWGVVAAIAFFSFIICIGPAPISFFITGELVSQKARGAACTWANVIFYGTRSILLSVYYPIKVGLGGPLAYFVLFCPSCILTTVILYYYLPETKGKTPEQAYDDANNSLLLCGTKNSNEKLLNDDKVES